MSGRDGGMVQIAFKAQNLQVAFRMMMPDPDSDELRTTPSGKTRSDADTKKYYAAKDRRRWRSLTMSVKAKPVSVDDGIETFEQAFMADVVTPDGVTLSDHLTEKIAIAYDSGNMPPLLPAPCPLPAHIHQTAPQ